MHRLRKVNMYTTLSSRHTQYMYINTVTLLHAFKQQIKPRAMNAPTVTQLDKNVYSIFINAVFSPDH